VILVFREILVVEVFQAFLAFLDLLVLVVLKVTGEMVETKVFRE
jgi:hypothetical protein